MQKRALAPVETKPSRIAIGVSDHMLGTSFDMVLRRLRAALPPATTFTMRLGPSSHIRDLPGRRGRWRRPRALAASVRDMLRKRAS